MFLRTFQPSVLIGLCPSSYGVTVLVPACVVNYPVGHGGTYREPHGGEFTVPALAWLQWQLKGDKESAKLFVGKKPELLLRDKWTLECNKKFSELKE